MGERSCSVCSAFILLHATLVINAVALATPFWITNAQRNFTTPDTNYSYQGLWQICSLEGEISECQTLPMKQTDWFVAVQVLLTLGTAVSAFALMAYYCIFVKELNFSDLKLVHSGSLLAIKITTILYIIGLIIFNKHGIYDSGVLPPKRYAWSYYTAIAGCVVSFIAAVAISRERCQLSKTDVRYHDI